MNRLSRYWISRRVLLLILSLFVATTAIAAGAELIVRSNFAGAPGIIADCIVTGDSVMFTWNQPTEISGIFLERYKYDGADAQLVYLETFDIPENQDTLTLQNFKWGYIYSLGLSYLDSEIGSGTVYALFDMREVESEVITSLDLVAIITLVNRTDAEHYFFKIDDRHYGLLRAGGQGENEMEIVYPAGDYSIEVASLADPGKTYTYSGSVIAGDGDRLVIDNDGITREE